jgi:hypothetical protein
MRVLGTILVALVAHGLAARQWIWRLHHTSQHHPHPLPQFRPRRLIATKSSANLTSQLSTLEATLKTLQSHQATKSCEPGEYGVLDWANGVACVNCPSGKWSAKGSAVDSICTDCAAGRFGRGGSISSACSGDCLPGSCSGAHAAHCSACVGGEFQAEPGKERCVKCPHGYYQPAGNASACKACPDGYTGNSNARRCIMSFHCSPGNYVNVSSDPKKKCFPCPAGKHSSSSLATSCSECPGGRFGLGGSNTSLCDGICPGMIVVFFMLPRKFSPT